LLAVKCCAGFASLSRDTAAGVSYTKKGEDPLLKEDSEYADWLWEIKDPQPTLFRLQKQLKDVEVNNENFLLV
jgi:hypothetical protein